ncbi:MAG: ligase-associated DNA damage response exonuclease [Flavobacteriaceae bacterium TMED206]|nr:MAG: ligase-associated DNA damage response exonuclease [Flavobacteriaceae bacterium TMED206]|tara:strand:- start:1011 stop:2012 length:1002 start_codon:yes stop_codon:yes gene_type:complete
MKLLEFTSKGIYCSKADVYLDPWRGVKKAIITHGHSDHARWGSKSYITQIDNVPILKHRLGDISVTGKKYGDKFQINGVTFSFHPAGHVPGSSQIRVEYRGEVWVFTGDFKTQDDKISTPYEPIKCNTFITECTFGLPVYKWEEPKIVHGQINKWWAKNKSNGITSLLLGYSLGKIQRLLKNLDPEIGKIYTHGATEKMTEVLRAKIDFPKTNLITRDTIKKEIEGNLVLAPPAVLGSVWSRKLGITSSGYASGWMAIRGARRRRAVDRSFVLSDHADWDGLLSAIYSTECENVITTHGYTDIFAKYLNEKGLNAMSEKTEYEQETPETENTK